jgi:hypothetical protein
MLLLPVGTLMPLVIEMLQSSIGTLKGVVVEMLRLLIGTLNPELLQMPSGTLANVLMPVVRL